MSCRDHFSPSTPDAVDAEWDRWLDWRLAVYQGDDGADPDEDDGADDDRDDAPEEGDVE